MRGRHLVTTDFAPTAPTAALADETVTVGSDRDRLRGPVADKCLQHPLGQLTKLDRPCADQPKPRHELGRGGLTPEREPRDELHECVLGAGHGLSVPPTPRKALADHVGEGFEVFRVSQAAGQDRRHWCLAPEL